MNEQNNGAHVQIAEKSAKDGRSLSGLGVLGLIVGVLLLFFTVLIGMLPALNYSLVLQDDNIRRILFCVSVGLILASLGDYAFYGIPRLFAFGGAAAIAAGLYYLLMNQPVEERLSGRVRVQVSPPTNLTVYLITSDNNEYIGNLDSKSTAQFYVFRLTISEAQKLTRECFTIAVKKDADLKRVEVQGAKAMLPHSVTQVFDLVYDDHKDTLSRRSVDGQIQDMPTCASTVPMEVLPTQKEVHSAPKADPSATTRPNLGWTYYGSLGEKKGTWEERVYDNKSRFRAAEPRPGDEAEVTSDVYLRTQPRNCRTEKDCDKLSEALGIVKVGERVTVKEMRNIYDRIWVDIVIK
jgi:hypothetical protein